jgi:quercetin dioxygenase-like cupin family protein
LLLLKKDQMMTNKIAMAAATLGILAGPAGAANLEILEPASRKAVVASKDQFTGTVLVEALFPANEQNGHSTGHVTFAPGARTAWHTHPKGQLLIITDGSGWVQEEGAEKRSIKAGDVVWLAPNVRHWHGATDTTMMRHIALSYVDNGSNVNWMEQVTDQQFMDQ